MRGRPHRWWSTLGRLDFIRVASPAARITAVSLSMGAEIVARRVPSIDWRPRRQLRRPRSHLRGLTRGPTRPQRHAAAEMRQKVLNSVWKRRRKFEDGPRDGVGKRETRGVERHA